jgi:hypothetical protein
MLIALLLAFNGIRLQATVAVDYSYILPLQGWYVLEPA